MGLIVLLIIFVGLAAIIFWVADWTSGARRYTAADAGAARQLRWRRPFPQRPIPAVITSLQTSSAWSGARGTIRRRDFN
jgi:hypothetical protein